MVLVDSSGWIEYLRAGPNVTFFRASIHDTPNLLVPSIAITEVVRFFIRAKGREAAREVAAQMQRAAVVALDGPLAEHAARLSLRHNLPMADALVYATAQEHKALLFTQDEDFAKLPGVRYVRKK